MILILPRSVKGDKNAGSWAPIICILQRNFINFSRLSS